MTRVNIDKLFEHSGDSKISELYSEQDIREQLSNAVVDLNATYEEDTFIMQFVEDNGYLKDILSLGNISTTLGGAKSRKTFFSTMLLGAFVSDGEEFAFRGNLMNKKALLIDTEQGKSHVQKVIRRIKTITSKDITPHLDVKAFRDVPDTKMRLAMLEFYLSENAEKYSFVCIDGIVDLVSDYNNQEECRKVIALIMSWTSIYNIHINMIIHTNKDVNSSARGHLGAELNNKSEVMFRVVKEESGTSRVKCETTRNKQFKDFEFDVNNHGIPERVCYPDGYFDNTPRNIEDGKWKAISQEKEPIEANQEFKELDDPF